MTTLYRKAVWFVKGLLEYTKWGYQKAARSFEVVEERDDISSRAFMITGANSGIGKSTAQSLAAKGATVYLVCRNKERGEAAKQEIIDATNNEKVELHLLDLSLPRDVLKFADEFVASNKKLDVLVNNAGVINFTKALDEDGLESNFRINTLGTYLLTTRLFPALEKSSQPQVITVSSGAMLLVKLEPVDLQFEKRKFDGLLAGCQNKRQQVVMTRRWVDQKPNIHFSSTHPGWADTPAVQSSMPIFHWLMQKRLRTPEEGADTVVWLCTSKSATSLPNGAFFQDRQIAAEHLPLAKSSSSAQDENLLMKNLEDLAVKFSTASTKPIE